MKVTIALPAPASLITQLEKQLADRAYREKLVSTQEEYIKRFEWIEKAYWRIVISLLDNVDAAGAGLIEMAVKQAAARWKQIPVTANRLSIQPAENSYREPHIVAVEFDKGKNEITMLAEKIDEVLTKVSKETGHTFRNRIKRPFTPYLAIIRQGRTIRALSTGFGRKTAFEPPVECALNRIVLNVSGKLSNGEQYRSQKLVKLRF